MLNATFDDMIEEARGLIDRNAPFNKEYVRGLCEVIARLYPQDDDEITTRAKEICCIIMADDGWRMEDAAAALYGKGEQTWYGCMVDAPNLMCHFASTQNGPRNHVIDVLRRDWAVVDDEMRAGTVRALTLAQAILKMRSNEWECEGA